ncbi:recombination directionality factor [Nonomuraea rubra]|uniref:recombination directionality factor n=1 Tax=Nonomuraea rubra TaxID=46180 RepID=UPI0033D7C2DF
MPIDPSVLQRRHWQDGRIRLGIKKMSRNGREYPSKIDTFRFTSPSEDMIRGVAEKYGGEVKPWKSPQGPQFEVITNAQRIPVIVPPNGLSQNMELWDGKLCIRRCTGVAMQAPFVGPCLCGADVELKRRPCKPHTRLGVFLKEVPSLGLWRLDSKGGNAAAELPNAAEFLAHAGTYVDAWLYVAERTGSFLDPKDNVVKATTYMVPGLTIEGIGFDELMSGEVARRAELGRGVGGQRAIEAAPATDYLAMIEAAPDRDAVEAIWRTSKLDPAWQGREQEVVTAAKARVAAFPPQPEKNTPHGQPAPEAPHREEPPHSPPQGSDAPPAAASAPEADRVRQHIMTAWSGTTSQLHTAFRDRTGTTMKAATLQQLQEFADNLGQPAAGPIADEPRKASERAEALLEAARAQNPAAAADDGDDIVDAVVVEDEEQPKPTAKALRDLGVWFGEAGVTIHTGKGSAAKNDEARFAWIVEHLGVEVTSTKDLSAERVDTGVKLLMQQAAARRKDLQQRIVNVWSDLDGNNQQLSAAFEQHMEKPVGEATNADLAAFLQKLSNSEVTPGGGQ